MARYNKTNVEQVTQLYADLAIKYNISLTQMALAYILQKPFLASVIIGATKMPQLVENIGSIDINLTEDIIQEIELISEQFPNPAP